MSLQQNYAGKARYYPDYISGPHRLIVGVACLIGDLEAPVNGLLDTAGEWCVLPPEAAERVGFDLDSDIGNVTLHTRFGTFQGNIERLRVRFPADEGEVWDLEASFFVSPDWPGPLVIGWKGCLEWMRFALDPGEDAFYFGAL